MCVGLLCITECVCVCTFCSAVLRVCLCACCRMFVWIIAHVHLNVCVCLFSCLCLRVWHSVCVCMRALLPARVCLPACSRAMMALFWMIDVLEGAARSPGWARASVWHTAASLLLYICRHSKTPPPLPSDTASLSNTANTQRFILGILFWSFCLFYESRPRVDPELLSSHFLLHSTRSSTCDIHLIQLQDLATGIKGILFFTTRKK